MSLLAQFDQVRIGGIVEVTGGEARHAAVIKHMRPEESMLLTDGVGWVVRGRVTAAEKNRLTLEVIEILASYPRTHQFVVVQALAKGDRSEFVAEIMTGLGVDEILAWWVSHFVMCWQGERGAKSLGCWAVTAREVTKQSRRFRIPEVLAADTSWVAERIGAAEPALVLHKSAGEAPSRMNLPDVGEILLIIGPRGGISPDELERSQQAGTIPVWISDGMLRTSMAKAVAIGQLTVLEEC